MPTTTRPELNTESELVQQFLEAVWNKIESDGISVSELARRTGMSRTHMHHLVHGESVPTLDTVQRIADALGLEFSLTEKKRKKTA